MNSSLVSLVLMFEFSAQASVQQTTVETVITCQQDDGDQWVEIGIALNDGPGLRAYVVAHDTDHGSAKLIVNRQVSVSKKNGKTVYSDSLDTLRLVVSKKPTEIVGSLRVLRDGPGGIKRDGLVSHMDLALSDGQSGLFDHFGERRVRVAGPGDILGRSTKLDHRRPFGDQITGSRSHDVHA